MWMRVMASNLKTRATKIKKSYASKNKQLRELRKRILKDNAMHKPQPCRVSFWAPNLYLTRPSAGENKILDKLWPFKFHSCGAKRSTIEFEFHAICVAAFVKPSLTAATIFQNCVRIYVIRNAFNKNVAKLIGINMLYKTKSTKFL